MGDVCQFCQGKGNLKYAREIIDFGGIHAFEVVIAYHEQCLRDLKKHNIHTLKFTRKMEEIENVI